MSRKGRGARESQWLVLQRCLVMGRRLLRGAAGKGELLQAVYEQLGADAYGGTEGEALNKRFDRDKAHLRNRLGLDVRYDAEAGGYVLAGHEEPLLDLSDAHLEALAFLADTFAPNSPHGRQVQELVDTLLDWLPRERRALYERMRGVAPEVDLRLRDNEPIAEDVWRAVTAAHNERQQLRFDYLSSRHEDGTPREHIVEPWHLYFSERGHYRLDAYCLHNDGPNGPWQPNRFFNYRVSRIVAGSAEVLPRRLPPTRTQRPHEVIFELSPKIARFGVSPRAELVGEQRTQMLEDGWVRVEGRTHDVFHLARNLLYYGANCRVMGGRELRGEMERLVDDLAGFYGGDGER